VTAAFASDVAVSTPGLSGYDPVAYFTDGKAVRGSGFHVTVQDGVTYAFTNDEHKTLLQKDPGEVPASLRRVLAYGVAVARSLWLIPRCGSS
jgi:hypothetical protein